MKKVFSLLAIVLTVTGTTLFAQEKKKPASPHEQISQTTKKGVTITINYGRPYVKGRTIGTDVEPKPGIIWRAGADSATTFAVNKDVKIEGQPLPAGKYAFFTIHNNNEWTLIFNKAWQTWGAYSYEKNKDQDALKVTVKGSKAPSFTEQLTYTIDKKGKVTLLWGDYAFSFTVKG